METLVLEDSPLAAYLEGAAPCDDVAAVRRACEDGGAQTLTARAGKGEAEEATEDDDEPQTRPQPPESSPRTEAPEPSFAPRGPPTVSSRFQTRVRSSKFWRRGPIAKLRNAYALAVTSTLGSEDNEHFLEHFRYIIIASQLLDDHIRPGPFNPDASSASVPPHRTEHARPVISLSLTGAVLSAALAFSLVWLLDWARGGRTTGFRVGRLALVLAALVVAGFLLYAYARRQWLKYLRRQAIDAADEFVDSAQTFESSTSSVITLIQEVELVSRGYRISNPLPPVSRIEGHGQNRKCLRLRRNLVSVYATAVPAFVSAVENLRPHINADDLDRFMEVYDIRNEDVREALQGYTEGEADESETLKHLRIHQFRLATLRRIILCSLMSLPATGRKADAARWRTAVTEMESLSVALGKLSQNINKLLMDEEHLPQRLSLQNQASQSSSPSKNSRASAQIHRISALSSGIRSLQAKLYLLREDSNRTLSGSNSESDLASLSTSLVDQYDAVGADLRSLMQAWETGRQALVDDISKQERRVSMVSSPGGPRSSLPVSLGGLTAVDEDTDPSNQAGRLSPRAAALQRLTGSSDEDPLTPPMTESDGDGGRDDEVFEAVANPRPRSLLTREQRVARMHEERERQVAARERRDASASMIRELQSVINLRPSSARRNTTGPGVLTTPTPTTPTNSTPPTGNV